MYYCPSNRMRDGIICQNPEVAILKLPAVELYLIPKIPNCILAKKMELFPPWEPPYGPNTFFGLAILAISFAVHTFHCFLTLHYFAVHFIALTRVNL